MFSKIDKRVLIISLIALIIVVIILFVFLKYFYQSFNSSITGGNTNYSQSLPNNNIPKVQVEVGSVGAEGQNGGGNLTVCQDKCGDGKCQPIDPNCANGLNCACPETHQDCPQDCR